MRVGEPVRLQHLVLLKFERPLSAAEETVMFEQVRTWPGAIDGLVGLRFGRDVGGRSGGYEYLLLADFADGESHDAYYEHPLHKAFSESVFGSGCTALRVDYPLAAGTLLLDG